MRLERVPIKLVVPWEKNPRGIKREDFDRLKHQIRDLGVYKPLVCTPETSREGLYVCLGGNMRLRALQDLGHKEVDISIVDAPTDLERIKYSLSDNDRSGFYDEQQLQELVYPFRDDIILEDFSLDLGHVTSLKDVVQAAGPEENQDGGEGEDLDSASITVDVPASVEQDVRDWLRNGQKDTPAGLGLGILTRMRQSGG